MTTILPRGALANLFLAALPARAVVFLADENVPFNYTESSKPASIVTDTAAELARLAGVEARFEAVEWESGYRRVQRDRDTCLHSMARARSRENLFDWIGPVTSNRWGV